MSEERRMILNMLAEKKITADEAAELLRALGPPAGEGPVPGGEQAGATQPAGGAASADSGQPGGPRPAPPGVQGAQAAGAHSAGHSRSILEEFLSRLDIDWGNLPFAVGGEAYRFEEEHLGRFGANGNIELDLTATNGRVEIFAWDRQDWRATIRKKVRAASEEQARQRGEEAAAFSSGPAEIKFRERSVGWGNTGVSIELCVPKDRVYEVRARSSNGRVVLDGLRCAGLVAKTANGKVGVRVQEASVAEVSTANGQVSFEGTAEKLTCHTANGGILVHPIPGKAGMRAELHTANGTIKVRVPQDKGVGYEIEARTGFGGLDVELPEFTVLEHDRQFGRRQLRGRTIDLAGKERKMFLTARTTNGSIRIMPRRAADTWDVGERPATGADDGGDCCRHKNGTGDGQGAKTG